MSEKLTVIIPVYNGEEFIESCILQLKDQTFQEFECILVNDGSTDRTKVIIELCIRKDDRFRLINLEKNMGVSNARNVGINESNGEYLMFLDSDDTYSSELLSEMLKAIDTQNSDYAACDHGEYKVANNLMLSSAIPLFDLPDSRPFNIEELIDNSNFDYELLGAPVWNKIFRKSFLVNNNLIFDTEVSRGEDLELNTKALILAKKISVVKKNLYTYRTEIPSSTINATDKYPMDIFKALINIKKFIKSKKLDHRYYDSYKKLAIVKFLNYFTFYSPKNQRDIMLNAKDLFKKLDIQTKNRSKWYEEMLQSIYDKDFDNFLMIRAKLNNLTINSLVSQLKYYQDRLGIEDPFKQENK